VGVKAKDLLAAGIALLMVIMMIMELPSWFTQANELMSTLMAPPEFCYHTYTITDWVFLASPGDYLGVVLNPIRVDNCLGWM